MKKVLQYCLLITSLLYSSCTKELEAPYNIPSVDLLPHSELLRTSVTLNGQLSSSSSSLITSFGFKISENSDVDNSPNQRIVVNEEEFGSFSASVDNLEIGTTYFYVAFITNGRDSLVTDVSSFTTETSSSPYITMPEIEYVYNIVARSTVEDDGGSEIVNAGFCWSKNPNPTVYNGTVVNCYQIGTTFEADLSELKENETYYIRAYADNGESGNSRIGYSEETIYTVPDNVLYFEDDKFREYIMANFDSDRDGELTRQEAAEITEINVSSRDIKSLSGIEVFSNLEVLNVYGSNYSNGQLTSLNLSSNKRLRELNCSYNSISELILPEANSLIKLNCSSNNLEMLYLTNQTQLEELYCNDNNFLTLDITSNELLSSFDCRDNENLQIVYVWEGFGHYNNPYFIKDNHTAFGVEGSIIIVDNNFRNYIVNNFDSNSDGQISEQEAEQITNISISTTDISNVLGIEYFENLRVLDLCGNNSEELGLLTEIDLTKNTKLERIYLDYNQLTTLDISQNSNLVVLSCAYNKLTNLDVTCNQGLTDLNCFNNQLTEINTTNNSELDYFNFDNNQVSNIDLSFNSKLKSLYCNNNSLSALNISNCVEIVGLECSYNLLSTLDIKGNSKLEYFTAYSTDENPLEYIYVSEDFYESNYPNFYKSPITRYSQGIIFEDRNFESYLLANFDTNNNGAISFSEADSITAIYLCTDDIESIQGIEMMPNLTALTVYGNSIEYDYDLHCYVSSSKLKSLDVSNNRALTRLDCSQSNLKSLDVSNNTELIELRCSSNQLTELDLSNNTKLMSVDCSINLISSLYLSNNSSLTDLNCSHNKVSSLDISNNTLLTILKCSDNGIEYLDLTNNSNLEYISCIDNQLTYLDLSNNSKLYTIWLTTNKLTDLDISNNKLIRNLYIDKNNLSYVKVWDGFDINSLTYSRYDNGVIFTSDEINPEDLEIINIADENFLLYLQEVHDTNKDGEISKGEAKAITTIEFYSNVIRSLEGIEMMPNLTTLKITGTGWNNEAQVYNYGELTTVDLSANRELTSVNLEYNKISSLNISQNAKLKILNCGFNQLTSLDVSNNSLLSDLYCNNNKISDLEIMYNTQINYLECSDNQISNLNTFYNTKLARLSCNSNELTHLDISNNRDLDMLSCHGNQLSSLDVSNNTNLTSIGCSSNKLSSLNVYNNTQLVQLQCYNNELTSLDVSRNIELYHLDAEYNQLTNLDVTNNTALITLWCNNNQLTYLDLSKNTILENLYCNYNKFSTLDISNNKQLKYLTAQSSTEYPLSTIYVWDGFNITNDPNFTISNHTSYIVK